MKRLFAVLFVLTGVAIFGAVSADTPVKDPTPEDGKHFRHDVHEGPLKGINVDVWAPDQCKLCHSIDAKGQPLAPVAQGHAPCMRSGCHADEFLAISKKRRETKGQEYLKAAQFCVGCHPEVPWPWKQQKTLIQDSWRSQREHHIAMEKKGDPPRGMDHYDHITLAKKKDGSAVQCTDCHIVDNAFALATHTPGHEQCMQCHSPNNTAFPLTECGRCHVKAGRTDWIKDELSKRGVKIDPENIDGSRPKTSVISCKGQREALANKKYAGNKNKKCFKHETSGHRLSLKNEKIQCVQCHHMIGNQNDWPKDKQYRSIMDLHTFKIIGTVGQEKVSTSGCGGRPDKNDAQHAACSGGTACHEHAKQVDLNCPLGERKCDMCHAERTNNEAF